MKMKDCPTSVVHRIWDEPEPAEYAPSRDSAEDKILAALKIKPMTGPQLIAATGLSSRTVYVATLNMGNAGKIRAEKVHLAGYIKKINRWRVA